MKRSLANIVMVLVLFGGFLMPAWNVLADERAELKARFMQRDAQLMQFKKQGMLGETWQGFVEPVKSDPLNAAAKGLMDAENTDRRRLYDLIASADKIKASDVGTQNAMRNFASATAGEFLKAKEGPWVRRGDVIVLKRDGLIGETWKGFLDIVTAPKNDEARIKAVVVVENTARQYTYARLARENESSPDREAQFAGSTNLLMAKSGEYYMDTDKVWRRKD